MLVGIKGKMGAGKSKSAEILKDNFKFSEYAMAEPIKKFAEILGFTKKELYGTQEDKLRINKFWGISARQFLQKFGTDVCRKHLPTIIPEMSNIWVQAFELYCQKNKNKNIIVSDVRFQDEANAIKKNGGIIIEIQRPREDEEWEKIEEHTQHASETEMDSIKADYVVINNKDLTYLKEELLRIIIKQYLC